MAPFLETALGLKPDSTVIKALTREASIPYFLAFSTNMAS